MKKTASADLRTIKTRRNLCEALLQLLQEKKINEITITMLCERALVNRKTFYRHYDSVSDVLSEIEDNIMSDFLNIFKEKNGGFPEIYDFFSEVNELINQNKHLYAVLLRLDSGISVVKKLNALFGSTVVEYLNKAFPEKSAESTKVISEYLMSGIMNIYKAWLWGETHKTLEQVADMAIGLSQAVIDCYGKSDF